jgi:cell division protein FtsB
MATRARRRPPRSKIALRWLAVVGLALLAFLYYRPLHSYVATRSALGERRTEVAALRAKHRALERRLRAAASATALEREARRLGFVRPGERLFIVKGIKPWLRKHGLQRSTIAGNG